MTTDGVAAPAAGGFPYRRDAAAAAVIALVGWLAVMWTYAPATPPDPFTQTAFGAAAMIASGRGFVDPPRADGGALDAFLAGRVMHLAPGEIPSTGRAAKPIQNQHRYLLEAVGAWWRMTGVSWARLAGLAGLMHAFSMASAFVLLRLFTPRWVALGAALWFGLSPLALEYAAVLRDFSKGGFILGSLALLLFAVTRASSPKAVIASGLGIGLLVGVGVGFRIDALVMAPVAVVVLVAFYGTRPWTAWRTKAAAIGAMVAAIAVTGGPVLASGSSEGTNTFHVIVLGQSDWFNPALRIEPAPYSVLHYYNDSYMEDTRRSVVEAVTAMPLHTPSRSYDLATRDLWVQLLREFPADAYARLLAAVNAVFNLPLGANWGAALSVVLVVAAAMRGLRTALMAAFLVLVLAGYPSLQFDLRHSFHLAILPIGTLALVVTWLAAGAPRARLGRACATGLAIAALVTLVPVAGLRAYQHANAARLADHIVSDPGQRVDVSFTPLGPHRVLASWPDAEGTPSLAGDHLAAYYVVEFDARHDASLAAVRLRFTHEPEWKPCPTMVSVLSEKGTGWLAFPVYSDRGRSEFAGLELGDEARRSLKSVRRLDAPDGLPLEWRLASNWREADPLAQRFWFEAPPATAVHVRPASTSTGCAPEFDYISAAAEPALDASIDLDGDGAAVRFRPVPMAAGETLVALVEVERGGVGVGFAGEDGGRHDVVLQSAGTSVVAVTAETDGVYTPYVEDARARFTRATRARVLRIGVAGIDGGVRPLRVVAP